MRQTDLFEVAPAEISVITLWRPWAQWVMLGWKTIETRTHNRFAGLVGQRIAIHAGAQWDDQAFRHAKPWFTEEQMAITARWARGDEFLALPLAAAGCILGTVQVAAHRELNMGDSPRALIECATKRYGLFLEDPKLLAQPEMVPGRQGIWKHRLEAAV